MLIGEEDGRAIWETQFLTWVPGLEPVDPPGARRRYRRRPLTSAGERRDAELIAPSADGRQEVASVRLEAQGPATARTDCTGSESPPHLDSTSWSATCPAPYSRRINIQLTGRCSPYAAVVHLQRGPCTLGIVNV